MGGTVLLVGAGGGGGSSDTTAPTISSFTATAGSGQVSLAWAATDNVGVTGYTVTRGGTTVYSGTGTSFTDTGLTNDTAYSYTLTAADAAANTTTATASATPAGGGGNVAASVVATQSTVVPSSVGGNTRNIALPATVAPGDILVILGAVNDGNTYTFTAPTGWTSRLNNSNAGVQAFVLTKTATGSEGGTSVSTTWNVGPDETLIAEAYTLRGIAAETPAATASGALGFLGGGAITCPSLTGLPADAMVLAMAWNHSSSTTTPPSGMTADASTGDASETAAFAHQYLASGGSAGGGSWNFSAAGNGGSLAVAFS